MFIFVVCGSDSLWLAGWNQRLQVLKHGGFVCPVNQLCVSYFNTLWRANGSQRACVSLSLSLSFSPLSPFLTLWAVFYYPLTTHTNTTVIFTASCQLEVVATVDVMVVTVGTVGPECRPSWFLSVTRLGTWCQLGIEAPHKENLSCTNQGSGWSSCVFVVLRGRWRHSLHWTLDRCTTHTVLVWIFSETLNLWNVWR